MYPVVTPYKLTRESDNRNIHTDLVRRLPAIHKHWTSKCRPAIEHKLETNINTWAWKKGERFDRCDRYDGCDRYYRLGRCDGREQVVEFS